MKSLRTVRYSLIAAAVAGSAVVSTPALADVSATAGVASQYLWRGQNLGGGAPVVSGSLDYSHDSGLFAGIWASSAGPGQEVDQYAGYAYSDDSFGFKAAIYNYYYPSSDSATVGAQELQEAYLNFSASGFFVDFYMGIGEKDDASGTATVIDNKDNYVGLGYTMDKVTARVGTTLNDAPTSDYTHVDLAYAFNSNVTFTLSSVVDADAGAIVAGKQDPMFVVSYTLPIDSK